MLKTFSKSLAALFVAAVLMLGLPALSFADEDTSGGGKQLSDFTDVNWNTVTLSLAQDEYTFDEKGHLDGIGIWDIKVDDVLNLYVADGDNKELLSASSYDYDYAFYTESGDGQEKYCVTESGTYYVKITLKDSSDGGKEYLRYVPVKISINRSDSYDLNNYERSDDHDDDPDCNYYVGDAALSDTAQVFDTQNFSFAYYGFDGEKHLESTAYTIDSTWYKATGDEETNEYSYTPIEGVPDKYGYYGIRLVGAGDYKGEHFVNVRIYDVKHSSGFYVSSDDVALASDKTVNDLQSSLKVSASREDEFDGGISFSRLLSLNVDYRIIKWGFENEDYVEESEYWIDTQHDDNAWDEVSLSDSLKAGTYAVKVEPLGDYYGDAVWLKMEVTDTSTFDSYVFDFDSGDRSNLVIGLDDLSISNLKVVASCSLGEEEKALTQGVDFKLGDTWYEESHDEYEDGGNIEGLPSEAGTYYIQVIGLGSFEGQTSTVEGEIYDCTDLSNYGLDAGKHLISGNGLLPKNMKLHLEGEFGRYESGENEGEWVTKTLEFGTDYTVRWGSYDSNGDFQLLDEDKYPEVTEETSNVWYLKIIGLGAFEGQEVLSYSSETIYVAECDHQNTTYSKDEDATCTESGWKGGSYCWSCGATLEEATEIEPLGHDYQEVPGTAEEVTCVKDGKEADKKCSRCGYYDQGDTISKLGGEHSYAADSEDTTPAKAATCTEDGYEPAKVCSNCGDKVEGKVIPKGSGAHDYVADASDTTPAKDATCTEDGYEPAKVCSICGDKVEGKTIDALGHNYEEVADSAKAATCTEAGKKADEKCSNCGDVVEGEAIAALGHDYKEVEDSAKAATCIADGKEADEKCSRCDDVKQGAAIKPTGEHSYEADPEDATPAKAATCIEDGYEPAQVCTVCNNKVEGHVVKATGHTSVVSKAAVAPTYKTAGSTEEKVCSTCGIVLQKQSVIAKLSAKAQSVNVKTATKTVKKAKVKKKAQTVSGAIKVTGAKGKVTYAKASGSGKLKINASNGKITVKKKTKKGTYSIKVRVNVAASADGQFKAYGKTVTVKVKVK